MAPRIAGSDRSIALTKGGIMRKMLVAFVATALFAAIGAAPASPAVGFVACVFASGGATTVPAGTPVTVQLGVAWSNRGRAQDFVNAQTTSASVNGTPIAGASSLWGAPEPVGDAWATFWRAPLGVLSNPGDSFVVELQITLQHPIPGGRDPVTGKQLFSGPGNLLPAGFTTCTITAV